MTYAQIRVLIEWIEEYKESQGQASTALFWSVLSQVVFLILIAMTLAELTTYCVYFHHIYKHDNSERLSRLLEPAVIRKRNKRNAITFFGQFCSFVFNISINIGIVIATAAFGNQNGKWKIIFIVNTACFIAMSMIEILTSRNLRSRMRLPCKSND